MSSRARLLRRRWRVTFGGDELLHATGASRGSGSRRPHGEVRVWRRRRRWRRHPLTPRSALIVGAGAAGLLHALALRAAGVAIAAVFDPDVERATLLASLMGATPTGSFEHATSIDAAVAAICSPPPFHVAQAEALARPDRLLFLEKPVALNGDELARLTRLPHVVPVMQWRSGRAARQLREAFRVGVFGAEPRVQCDMRLWRDEAYFAGGRRGRSRWGCGAMLSIGVHAIDLLVSTIGRPIVEARGRAWSRGSGVDVPTNGELELVFEGGARAALRLTVDTRGANDVRLIVRGAAASAKLLGGEADPTAAELDARGVSLDALASGAVGSPLLVPFVHEAITAFDAGASALSIDDVAVAHRLAFGM